MCKRMAAAKRKADQPGILQLFVCLYKINAINSESKASLLQVNISLNIESENMKFHTFELQKKE